MLAVGFAAECHADCESLATPRSFPDTTISSAKTIAADASRKLPAFCEVTGVVTPVPGSQIGVVYRLPEKWNGKMLGIGGGGYAGNVQLRVPEERRQAAVVARRGRSWPQRGGPGPDRIDMLDAMDRWAETGKAPDRLLATKPNSALTRPVCAYPALPRYKGTGNPNEAANFDCR